MSIEVGSKLQGKVTGITKFGAFVELPDGSTGLVHISEVADNYVKDINDHLKVGDQVEVKVINVEKDGKIGLSIKKAIDKPEVKDNDLSGEIPGLQFISVKLLRRKLRKFLVLHAINP